MNKPTTPIGNQIDADLRDSAPSVRIAPRELRTLADLLTAIPVAAPNLPLAMLRSTAGHISSFLNVPIEQLAIEALVDLAPAFRNYLRERRFKRNSVRSYANFLSILLRTARELGWESPQLEIPDIWKPILAAMQKHRGTGTRGQYYGCAKIVRWAIRQGKTPSDFSDDDLRVWGEAFLKEGRSYEYMVSVKSNFRRALRENGLADKLPGISCNSAADRQYGVPLREFPPPLRDEVEALLQWKQAPFAPGRPRRGRHRPGTAKHLQDLITRLYGFVVNIRKRKKPNTPVQKPNTLVQLVSKKLVTEFVEWSLNKRKLKGEPFANGLWGLCAAMDHNPEYKARDFSWFRELLASIQPDSESEKQERKLKKCLPYETIAHIPRMIRDEREKVANLAGRISSPQNPVAPRLAAKQASMKRQIAILAHDELLLSWLVELVWRQRNIRECQMGMGRNLFKAEIPAMTNMAIPQWVQERIALNPQEQIWQVQFRENETKTGHKVHFILPHCLVPLLEEYLQYHRPILLRGSDPGTLFVNRDGCPLTSSQVNYVVSNLTMQYGHRRVTPHLCRDIWAFWWLKQNPKDYLTLSKVLWHRDLKTTVRKYGSTFDESEALLLVEEWRDRQGQGPGQLPSPTAESFVNQRAESCSSHGRLQPRITEALSNLVSRDHEFQALPPAAKQNELSAIAGFIETHPWLAKLISADSRKDAAGTAHGFGSEGIRRKAA